MDSIQKHRNKIIGARRKNNIYGELDDPIVIDLLNLGCDGVFYNPRISAAVPVTMYARSGQRLYLVKLSDAIPDDEIKTRLGDLACVLYATPVYCIQRSGSIKFYDLKDSRFRKFE